MLRRTNVTVEERVDGSATDTRGFEKIKNRS
jgi:hypothetical protein